MDDPGELGLLPPWHLLGGPGVRWERREPLIRVTISPAEVQAIIEATRTTMPTITEGSARWCADTIIMCRDTTLIARQWHNDGDAKMVAGVPSL